MAEQNTTVTLSVEAKANPGNAFVGTLDSDLKAGDSTISSLVNFEYRKIQVDKAPSGSMTTVKVYDAAIDGWSFDFFLAVATRPLLLQMTANSGGANEALFTVHLSAGVPFILGSRSAQDATQTDDLASAGGDTTIGKITVANRDTSNSAFLEVFIGGTT